MDGFVDGSAAVLACLPVCLAVARPLVADVGVSAVGIVVALLQTLVILVAPVLSKVLALHAEVVVATLRRGVRLAAVVAEFAIVAAVETFVAVTTLQADEVVEVILERTILRAIVVLAMVVVGTVLTLATIFAEFVHLEAVAAVGAEMLVPVAALRTDLVFAMVVSLALLAQHAVRTIIIVWALLTVGTNMFCIFARLDAIAVSATRIFTIGTAATLAKAAVVAEFHTFAFHTTATLIAEPTVLLAAVDAMVAAAQAPLYIVVVSEAEVAFRTMFLVGVAALAKAAFGAEWFVAIVAFGTVDAVLAKVVHQAVTTDFVFHAGAFCQNGFFTTHNHAVATIFAFYFGAVCAMPNDQVGTTALLSTFAKTSPTIITEILRIFIRSIFYTAVTPPFPYTEIVTLIRI